jgi:hypothetical protein
MNQDQEHLRLLSIFHYVVGGVLGLCACFPVIHLIIGILALGGGLDGHNRHPGADVVVGLMFIVVALVVIVMGWALAVAVILAGRMLAQRRNHTYCLVVAAIECMFMPFGTVLGVFTIIVLIRPSVKALFEPPAGSATQP